MIPIPDLNLNFYILKPILLFQLVEQFKKKYIDFIEFFM
jgi:hypothetical protein